MNNTEKLLIEGSGANCKAARQCYLDSYIKVYESGIAGKTTWGIDFQLTYEEVLSVEVNRDFLVINSSGNRYSILVENPVQIHQAIHKQKTTLQQN